jgi:hypothetical protein
MRILRASATALAAAALLVVPAAAEFEVKVSLSAEDPDVQMLETDAETVDFFLFIDGEDTRGGEFGIAIDGGELVHYLIDTERPWIALPMANPYPGTIAQAGTQCYEAPALLGKMTVRPSEPGGYVSLDVIPSARAEQATMIQCDETGAYGFRGFPAAVNGDPVKPHSVMGDNAPSPPSPGDHDHDHGDHDGHDHSHD